MCVEMGSLVGSRSKLPLRFTNLFPTVLYCTATMGVSVMAIKPE